MPAPPVPRPNCAAVRAERHRGRGAWLTKFLVNWGKKAIRRKTTGSGRCEHLRTVRSQYAGIAKAQRTYAQAVDRARKVQAKKLQ